MSKKKEAFYFSHDANAKDDPKCVLLIEQLGMEGYGIFWMLIETLRDQPDYCYPVANISAIARRFNTTTEKVRAVVYGYELFVVKDDVFFYSDSLNRRMTEYNELRAKRSIAGSKGNKSRWGISQCDSNAIGVQSQSIANKVKESKINKKEIDKEKLQTAKRFAPPSLAEVSEYIQQKRYCISAQAFIDFYESNGWKVGKNQMKDWKAAVRTWNNRENNNSNSPESKTIKRPSDNEF